MSENPDGDTAQPQIQPDTPDDDPPSDVEDEDELPRGQHGPTADLGDG